MFDQAMFDSAGRKSANPWTMSISIVIQAALISAAVIIPLLHIEALPPIVLTVPKLAPPHVMLVAVPNFVEKMFPATESKNNIPRDIRPIAIPKPRETASQPIIDPLSVPFLTTSTDPSKIGELPTLITHEPIVVAQPKPERTVVTSTQPAMAIDKTYRIGGDVNSPVLKSAPPPAYPALAKAARVQGTVRLNGIISRDGTVRSLELVSGHPLLVQAALAAVRAWLYEPARLNGQPVDVILVIDVNFRLSQ